MNPNTESTYLEGSSTSVLPLSCQKNFNETTEL